MGILRVGISGCELSGGNSPGDSLNGGNFPGESFPDPKQTSILKLAFVQTKADSILLSS